MKEISGKRFIAMLLGLCMVMASALCGVTGIQNAISANSGELAEVAGDMTAAAAALSDASFTLFLCGDNFTEEQLTVALEQLTRAKERLENSSRLMSGEEAGDEAQRTAELLEGYISRAETITALLPNANTETRKKLLEDELAPIYNEIIHSVRTLGDYNQHMQIATMERAKANGYYSIAMLLIAAGIAIICIIPAQVAMGRNFFADAWNKEK